MGALSDYTQAVRTYDKGEKEKAAELLSKALGAEETLGVVADAVDHLLAPGARATDVVAPVLADRIKKERR